MRTTRLMRALVSACAFFSMLAANAEKVTPEQAATAARSWIRGGYSLDRRVGRDVGAVRTVSETNGAAFHVVSIKDGGFLVMGSDTTTEPVVAFASAGALVEDERNPLWVLLRGDFAARERARNAKTKRLLSKGKTGERSPESRWAELLASEGKLLSSSAGLGAIADVRVDALVKSAWSQQDYRNYGYTSDDDICYNYYTPNHWPCGCVATAGAQVMRFHAYPTASVTAGTYACRVGATAQDLTMLGGAYDWDAMTLVPEFGCSAASREAIGRLTYDVGVSVGMSYGSGGSSAAGYMLEKRFVDRFQYANAVSVVFQDGFFTGGGYPYSLDRFKAAVVPNFDAGLPVVMGISGSGGHAVVGDGYGYSDGVFYLHVNLGWANLSGGDAWYAPPDIDDYDTIDSIVYNVWPTGASGASIVSGRILSPEGLPVEGASVRALSGGAQTAVATSGAKGLYTLKVQPGDCLILAEKDGQSASNLVTVAACVSPHVDESGSYWSDVRPQIGNVCDNDLTLSVAGTPEPEPPAPTNLTWYTTKTEAFAAAEASGKRILLVYGRDACGNTTATRNSTCENADVKAKLLADYVLWYSDCDTQSFESGKYLVNFNGYLPGVTVIDPEFDQGIVGTSGYLDVSGMLALLADAENWEPPEPPENDNFADATELTGTSGSALATNEGATNEAGEPLVLSWSSALTTVWWKWTAPAAGSVTFDTIGSTFDTVMGVYAGSALSSLATVAQDDDGANSGNSSKCTFDCTAGTTYYVCVAGYNAAYGDISLQWALTASEEPQPPTPIDPSIEETTPTNHLRYGLFFRCADFTGTDNASQLRSLCVLNGKMLKSNTKLQSVDDEPVSDSLQALSARVQAGDSVLIYFGGLRAYERGRRFSGANLAAALSALPPGVKVAVIAEDSDLAIQFVDEARGLVSPERAADIGWCAVDSGYEGVCRKLVTAWGEAYAPRDQGVTSFVYYLSSGVKDGSADTNGDGCISVQEACAHAATASQADAVEVVREASGRVLGEILECPAARVEIEGGEFLSELCLGASDANRSTMWTADPLTIESADFGSVMECQQLSKSLSAAGGVPPYEFVGQSTLPPGLSLDPSGRLVGRCIRAGTYSFCITVSDDKLSRAAAWFTLAVTKNPNRPPVLVAASPARSWVHLTSPGRAQEFEVSVTDPEGAALAYSWTLDGEPIAGATGESLALSGDNLPDDGEHILACAVSDGVWTDYVVHSWTLWRETYEDVRSETVDGYTWYHQDGSIIAVTPQPVGKVTVPSLFYDEVVHFGVETNFNKRTGEPIVRVYDEPVTERVEVVACAISGAVFKGCRGLAEVVLPSGIGWIAEEAFDDSPDLKRISMPVGGNGCYFTRDGVLYEGDLRGGCTLVRVPEGYEAASFDGLVGPRVEGIYEHAFLNCAKLTAIEVNTFSADAASFTDYTGCSSFTAFAWKGPKPRLGEYGWFIRNGALCYGYAYSEDGYGEFTLRKVPMGLESFTVDSSIRWIDTWAFVGANVRELRIEGTSSYYLEELFGSLAEVLVGWPDDGFVSPVKRVVYRSSGSDSYIWKTFIRNFQNDYPFADVDFVETREAWNANWEWDVPTCDYGDRVTAYVYGWHFGLSDQPSGAISLPAFGSGNLAVEYVESRAFSGMEDVTSITFPYTIQWISWDTEIEGLLPNVRELVFEGRIPDGFYDLVSAAPNLERIVYSANPRYCEEWESITNEFEGITFVKGAEPAEPQFEFECGGEAHLVSVWPTKGEVKVPAVWNACPVRGIYSDVFAEATEMTKLRLPASLWEFDEYMLEEAVALEEIEVYQPTRAEFAKMAVEEWMWDEEAGKSYKVLRPDYGETFDFWKYDTGIWHYTSEDGALFAEYETWFWDEERGADVPGSWRRLVKCPAAKVAFDFANDVHEISDCALAGGNHAVCFNERPYAPDYLDSALCVNTNACTVMYPYYGGANGDRYGYPWSGFVRDFKSSYPEALVTFEPYFLPDAKEDYEWRVSYGAPGEGVTLSGLTLGSVRNPTGAVTIPATFDGQPVARIEVDDAFAYFGTVTSIRFPYTLRAILFDSSRAAFGAVTKLVFDGGVPEGFDELVAATPNLKTVVYSANPRYKAGWLQRAAEYVKIEFVKGEIPSEPQWYFGGAHLGDGYALDDPDGFAAVWPAPEGEVTVPFMWAQSLVYGISENAFKGCDKLTKIRLPSCVCDLSLRTFDDCAALEAIEFYAPTREEYEASAPYWEDYGPSYEDAFGEGVSCYDAIDGMLICDDCLVMRVPRAYGSMLVVPEFMCLGEGSLLNCSNLTTIVFTGCESVDVNVLAEAPTLAKVIYPGEPWLSEYWAGVKEEAVGMPELAGVAFEPMRPGETVWNAELNWGDGAYLYGGERYPAFWSAGQVPADFVFPTFVNDYPLVGLGDNTLAGVSNLTSITLPYTVRSVGSLGCDLSGVTRLVFEGGVPEGFDALIEAAGNLNTVVYSANPRYKADWLQTAANHVNVDFVKGGIPSEPQWCVQDGVLGGDGMWWEWDDVSEEDVLVGFPCVWPAPEGAVEVPEAWAGQPICGIATGAFYGMDKITSLKLPRVEWIGEEAFRGCSSLAAFEMEGPGIYSEDPSYFFVEDGVLLSYDEGYGWYPAAKEDADYELPHPWIVFDGCRYLETVTVAEEMIANEYVSLATFITCPNFRRMNVVRRPGDDDYGLVCKAGLILADAGRELVGFTARAEKVMIPSTVESIRASAFAGMVGLSEVVFTGSVPSGVEAVAWACPNARIVYPSAPWLAGDWRGTALSFAEDETLSNVVFAASVPTGAEWCASQEWGCGAYLYGFADDEIGYSCVWGVKPEGALELPEKVNGFPVTGVSGDAFWGLTNLTSITFPYMVESVGSLEQELPSVTELVFWGGVPSGLDDMLESLSNVTKVVYSANPRFAEGWVDFIAEAAESHPSVSFEKGGIPSEPQWYVEGGVLGGDGMWWEWDDASGKDVLVGFPCVWPAPEGAVEAPETWAGEPISGIAVGAFYGMDKVTSLKLPRVDWIGEEALRGCLSLAAFEMDEPNVTFYEDGGFDWYDNSPYYVEDGVLLDINEGFGWYPPKKEDADYWMPYRNIVFDGCAYLETVTASAFWYDEPPLTLGDFRTCPNFREVVVRDQKIYQAEGGDYSFRGGMVLNGGGEWLVGFLSCGKRASVTYPVYGANEDAFAGCRNLKVAVVDPDLVSGGYVTLVSFDDSPNFERIELAYDWPGDFEEKDGAFVSGGCELAGFAARSDKVVIPACVTYVNDCAFGGLENLSEIVCSGAVPGNFDCALLNAGVLPKISVSPNPRIAERWAEFARMMKDEYSLDIAVEARPFSGETEWCYDVEWQWNEQEGRDVACAILRGDDNGFPCVWPLPEDGRLVIPETIDGYTVIGVRDGAFSGLTNLTAVTFPATVRYLEDWCFYEDCTSLVEVTMPCSMSGFCPNDNARIRLTLVPARRVEGIGDEWTLRVDHGVGLEGDCFCGLPALTEVTLAEGIWELGDSAFSSCPNLKKVTLPSSLWNISWGAFTSCDALQEACFLGDAPVVAEDAFMDSTNFTAFVCAGTTGWSGIEGDEEIPAAWYAGYADHPISGFDVDVSLMVGAEVWTNLTVSAGTKVCELPFPTEDGLYVNLGWFADEGLVQAVDGNLCIPAAGKVFYANRRLDLARHMNDGTLEFTTGEGAEAWYGSELTAPKGGAAAETLTFLADGLPGEDLVHYLVYGVLPHAPWMETKVTGACYFEYSVYRSPFGAETLWAANSRDLVVLTVDGVKVDMRSAHKSANGWTTFRYLIGEGEHTVRWTPGWAYDTVAVPGENEWMELEQKPVTATVGDIAADAFGPRKTLEDWTEKLVRYHSWNENDLARFAAGEETKFADSAEGYAARIHHAYATLMQLGERPSFKDFCASAGLRLDYLRLTCDVDDADTAFGAGTAGVNETVDRVVAEDLPLIETALADLEAIPTNWTGRILLTPGDYPIDEDVFLDQADLGFLRASLHGALAAIRYLAGYDLTVDWEKLRALRDDYAGDLKAVSNRGEIAFQRFRDEQAEFFSRSRDRASLAESREQVRAALAAVLAADRLATARADDELHLVNYGDQDEAASRRVRAVFDNLHLASESLDEAVDVDVEALWSQCGKTGVSLAAATGVDPSLLPNGWIARVYLGALFNGKINRKYAPETYLDEGSNLVIRLETMRDPTFAGLLPQMTIGCISNLVDRYYPGPVEHCEWNPMCTIVFETNGGSAVAPIEAFPGDAISAPQPPVRAGYAFVGWFVDETASAAYAFSVMPDDDLTLYARWTANSYAVAFDGNGATSGAMEPQDFTYDVEQALASNVFEKVGHAFSGWATNATGEAAFTDGETVLNLTAEPDGALTLFATWTPNAYTVSFDGNGATSGTMDPMDFTYDAEQALATNGFAKVGYTFAGWATNATGEAVYADGAEVVNLTAEADGAVTLFAMWTPNSYSIGYHGGEGSEGEMPGEPMTYDEEAALYSNLFFRVGYTFVGWTDDELDLESVDYLDGAVVSNLTAEVDGAFDLWAVWTPNSYTVAFDGNGATSGVMEPMDFTYDEAQALTSNAFTRVGASFAGWELDATSETVYFDGEVVSNLTAEAGGTVTLKPLWEIIEEKNVYVTWHANFDADETVGEWRSIDSEFGNAATSCPFRRLGHAFTGWYTAPSGGARVDAGTRVTAAMTDLYAHWQTSVAKLTVATTFHGNGGEPAETNVELVVGVPFGSQDLPKFVAPDGKQFDGWFGDSACQVAMATNMPVSFMLTDVYVGWRAAEQGEEPAPQPAMYGPWGEGEIPGAAQQTPTTLFDVTVRVDGKPARLGDCVRVRDDKGEVCGYGKVLAEGGRAMVTLYAAEGTELVFDLWLSESGTGGGQVVLSAEESYLAPARGTDVQGGQIDFFSNEAASQVLHIDQPGWSVISLAIDPFEGCNDPAAVFGPLGADVEQVVRGGRADSWRPGMPGTLRKVERGVGYWIKTKRGGLDLTVRGNYNDFAAPTNRVFGGWNLLGYPFVDARDVEAALKTALEAELVSAVVDGAAFYMPDFDGGLSELRPGRAYWVLAARDGDVACDVGRARLLQAADGAGEIPFYGPWGDGMSLQNPDRLAPTIFGIVFADGGVKASEGDCLALTRIVDGKTVLCGLGRVGADGSASAVCYVPEDEPLSVRLWLHETGLELPGYVEAGEPIAAPASGSVGENREVKLESAGFAEAGMTVAEGSNLCIRVRGGDSQKSTMVSVGIAYQTAAAADLDLAKMTVDGVLTKKFPVTLLWDAGEIGEREIVIPVKPDKAKEGDERFLLQLYDPVKLTLGETTVCTVTIEDRTQGGVTRKDPYVAAIAVASEGGSVSGSGYLVDKKKVTLKAKAAKNFRFAGWYPTLACASNELVCTEETLVVDRTGKEKDKPGKQSVVDGADVTGNVEYYARFERQADKNVRRVSVAYDTARGKVTGAGYYPIKDERTKVTVKATAAKGFVFVGWYDNSDGEAEFTGECLSQAASYVLQGLTGDVELAAKFVSVEDDMNEVTFGLYGDYAVGKKAVTDGRNKTTRTMTLGPRAELCGVPVRWPLDVGALTPATVKAAKLPSGLKLVKTAVYVDPTAKKKVVDHYEWSVEGVPTAASKAKRGAPDELEPSHVVFTVTTAGKSSVTVNLDLTIEPLPAWAVGTFDGAVVDGEGALGVGDNGLVTFTVKANGGISGKYVMNSPAGAKSFSFSLKSFAECREDGRLVMAPVVKLTPKATVTNFVYLSSCAPGENEPELLCDGKELGLAYSADGDPFEVLAGRGVWADKDFPSGVTVPVFKLKAPVSVTAVDGTALELKFGAKGKLTVKTGNVSANVQMLLDGFDDETMMWHATAYVGIPAKKNSDFGGWYGVLTFDIPGGTVTDAGSVRVYEDFGEEGKELIWPRETDWK